MAFYMLGLNPRPIPESKPANPPCTLYSVTYTRISLYQIADTKKS